MDNTLKPDVNGFCIEKFVRKALVERIRGSKLVGFTPKNATIQKIYSSKAEEYAEYFMRLIRVKTNFQANIVTQYRFISSTGNLVERERVGLFSIDPVKVKEVPRQMLFDPETNIDVGIRLYTDLIIRENKLPDINSEVSI
jgi:hypothetical protein